MVSLVLNSSKLQAEAMESFSLGGEWGGRAGTSESCCCKIILQPLVLPTLPLPPLRAATKCSVRVRAPHAQPGQVCAAGRASPAPLAFLGCLGPHGETLQCSLFSRENSKLFGEPELRGAGLKPRNTWGNGREGNYLCPPKNNVGTRRSGQKPAGINSGWKCEGFHPV